MQSFMVKPPDFDPHAEISRADADSRRSARRMGRGLELSLERAGVRRRRLRGGDAESARLDRLRAEIHRRDQWRLGRPRLRRHHGRRPTTWPSCPTPTATAWRRPADPTAATWSTGFWATRSASKRSSRTPAFSICAAMFGETEELWFPHLGIQRHALGQPGDVRALVAQPLREGVPHAHAGDSRRAGFPRAHTARACSCSPRCNCRRCPRKLLIFPDEGHWILKPQNSLSLVQDLHRLDRYLDQKVKILLVVVILLVIAVPVALLLLSNGTDAASSTRRSRPSATQTPVKVQRRQSARRAPHHRRRRAERSALHGLRSQVDPRAA